jgi:hypothetical protein
MAARKPGIVAFMSCGRVSSSSHSASACAINRRSAACGSPAVVG